MRHSAIAAILTTVALSAVPARAAVSDFLPLTYIAPTTGQSIPYRLHVPANYDPAKEYPLITLLHGAGESGSDNVKQVNHDSADLIMARVKQPGWEAFVLAPQTTDSWYTTTTSRQLGPIELTLGAIGAIEQTYSIDTDRRYLTGLSLGGIGTYATLKEAPDMFAAAVPICGNNGADSANAVAILSQIPIWIFHAANDATLSVTGSDQAYAALSAAGGDVQYTRYPTGGHHIWDDAYRTPELWDWMYAQALPEPASVTLAGLGALAVLRRPRAAKEQR